MHLMGADAGITYQPEDQRGSVGCGAQWVQWARWALMASVRGTQFLLKGGNNMYKDAAQVPFPSPSTPPKILQAAELETQIWHPQLNIPQQITTWKKRWNSDPIITKNLNQKYLIIMIIDP